jgi:hypothetical protein
LAVKRFGKDDCFPERTRMSKRVRDEFIKKLNCFIPSGKSHSLDISFLITAKFFV